MNPLLLDLPTEFSSDHLLLRCYRLGDSAMYFQMLRANRDHLYEFLPPNLMAVQSEGDVEAEFRRLLVEWNLRNLFIFGVWEKATGRYVGESYLANADWDVPRIEVGYFIVKANTGKGYATEAARATIRYAFEHLKVLRVDLRCAADNPASMRVAEHCGFVPEGRFRQHHRKKDGTLVDMLWYGLPLDKWKNTRADGS
jgi:ribosomal-protein-serine acetyltransferase